MLPWPVEMVTCGSPQGDLGWLRSHILWFKLGDFVFHPPVQNLFHIENRFVWLGVKCQSLSVSGFNCQ